jgi:hypothetical protein
LVAQSFSKAAICSARVGCADLLDMETSKVELKTRWTRQQCKTSADSSTLTLL